MAAEKEKRGRRKRRPLETKEGKGLPKASFPTSSYTTPAAVLLPQQSHSLIEAARQPSPLKNGWGGERWMRCSRSW